ncbi:MAG: response regulator [Coleofasciculaceae cyanobacterium SM2_3_26]|nr:response regulator [Coleofasciculaceae cyanobacterium SM2_3_26]
MAGVYKLDITESAADLKQLLRTQKTASDKERIQLLYLLKTQQATTVQSAAALLGRHRVTVQEWLRLYRKGGLSGLLSHKPRPGRQHRIPQWAQDALNKRLQQEEGLHVVAEAEDGETAVAAIGEQLFDIVILDIGLPGIGGVEACRQIKQQHPNLPVLALTSHAQPALIARLIEAQVQGYCVKGVDAESLVLAIRSVVSGASWWDPTATKEIQSAFHYSDRSSCMPCAQVPENPLTKRELEILTLVAAGKSNQEIATRLYIAPGTVRVHVHAILQKLEVRDRTQAAVLALQQGLIAPENLPDRSR